MSSRWFQEVTNQVQCWRQLGCELAEAQKGSNLNIYYAVLTKVKALIEGDMEFLERALAPEPHETNGHAPEKVADCTHRGPGL